MSRIVPHARGWTEPAKAPHTSAVGGGVIDGTRNCRLLLLSPSNPLWPECLERVIAPKSLSAWVRPRSLLASRAALVRKPGREFFSGHDAWYALSDLEPVLRLALAGDMLRDLLEPVPQESAIEFDRELEHVSAVLSSAERARVAGFLFVNHDGDAFLLAAPDSERARLVQVARDIDLLCGSLSTAKTSSAP